MQNRCTEPTAAHTRTAKEPHDLPAVIILSDCTLLDMVCITALAPKVLVTSGGVTASRCGRHSYMYAQNRLCWKLWLASGPCQELTMQLLTQPSQQHDMVTAELRISMVQQPQ